MSKFGFYAMVVLMLLFTIYGFFVHIPCDVDRIYLSCRLHPFTTGDLIGCILFYSGALWLGGITSILGIDIYEKPHSTIFSIAGILALAGGIALIWNT